MTRPRVPVAVVGTGVVLPDALDAATLWKNVLAGKSSIRPAPADRWRRTPAHGLSTPATWDADRSWSDLGGYVSGFDTVFDPTGLHLDAAFLRTLDPLVQWLVHCGREALRGCGLGPGSDLRRVGAVIGNLSFPSSGMSLHAESVWLRASTELLGGGAAERVHPGPANPWDRFMSGLPAQLVARALGLGAGAYALDAACASSLYAIRLACDRLADGSADVMLAGAVNRADDLFIHVGFCSLGAISKHGHSRPFDRTADGLIPAEGAALVALKRLPDAERDGDRILGVLRGVGLSNDGRGRSLLAPAQEGQARAMRAAYQQADLTPDQISLIECHATGTPVGDATELASLADVFGEGPPVAVGSLKSNLGHLITSAGVAGLIKVLGALDHRVRPPTLGIDDPIPALRDSRFRPVLEAEPWTPHRPGDRLRASVSAFGFGGNNAHLLVEEAPDTRGALPFIAPPPRTDTRIAIVGIGAAAAGAANIGAVAEHWQARRPALSHAADGRVEGRMHPIEVGVEGLRFPPRDLERALPQQVLALRVVLEAMQGIDAVPRERCLLAIGMGADTNVARYGARWRVADWFDALCAGSDGADPATAEWIESAREALIPALDAAGVVGTMPNIPANRLNRQLDAAQAGYTVSAEEASGLVAIDIAVRSLRSGETDVAIAGAVDLCCNRAHLDAWLRCTGRADGIAGDAGAAFVLMRHDDAVAAHLPIYALLDEIALGGDTRDAELRLSSDEASAVEPLFGHAHAASGALLLATAVIDLALGERSTAVVGVESLLGGTARARLIAPPTPLGSFDTILGGGISAGARTLTFAAHAPEPTLPPLPRSAICAAPAADAHVPPSPQAAPMRSPSPLPPAPRLPSTTWAPSGPSVPPTSFTVAGEPAPVGQAPPPTAPIAAPPAPVAPVAAPPAPVVAPPSSAGLFGTVARAHRAHIDAMGSAHHAWMEMHQRMTGLLLHGLTMQEGRVLSWDAPAASVPHPERALVPSPTAVAALPAPIPATAVPLAPTTSAPAIAPHVVPTAPPTPHAVAVSEVLPVPRSTAATAAAGSTGSSGGVPHTWIPERPVWRADALPGLKCSRSDLEVLASDRISRVFGPAFEGQDGYTVQVRMPEPPMLLADRVIGLDAEPKTMGTGTIWTETDVRGDAWYLTHEHMPAGIMIESGQADLLLVSWLGIDFHNQGERAYRLLGCELMYHGGLPTVGDTLQYDIHVDGHAKHGDVRIFFFHYDCRVDGAIRLSVRQGQAGFFTTEELAASAGVLWDAETAERVENPRLDPGPCPTSRRAFDAHAMVQFSEGDLFSCFGEGFHRTASHTRSPRGGVGRLHLLERVDELSFNGGPWGRGYLRATDTITPDDWFFDGHFKNDPCMPGTLMFEGCLEAMAFYLAAMGFTIDRDGWRFEPVPETAYRLLCRGQVTPRSRELVYEVFVEEVWDGDTPTLWADLLCTVDGLRAFHCRRMGLQLTPDWPKAQERRAMAEAGTLPDLSPDRVARIGNLALDYDSILACAYGRPSEAFGEKYAIFDGGRRCPRLPGPPYLFITRILDWQGELGGMQTGTSVETEFEIDANAWYFDENGQRAMPWCVLLEAALQPCGWLASFTGGALTAKGDVCFRNLDGNATLTREIPARAATFRTRVVTTRIARSGSTTVFAFDVLGWLDDEPILTLSTVFGFFPPAALVHQVGLGVEDRDRELRYRPSTDEVDLTTHPERFFGGTARIAPDMLRMIDRITGLWLTEGEAGEGIIRCEKRIDARDWYFRAHFYQDAVMPGSLGIEAMLEALQCLALAKNLDHGLDAPVFEVLPVDVETTWRYRGQVIPEREKVVVVLEATQVDRADGSVTLHGRGSLWVDDLRIYEAPQLAVRLTSTPRMKGIDGPKDAVEPATPVWSPSTEPTATTTSESAAEPSTSSNTERRSLSEAARTEAERLSLAAHPWLGDHRPTFTVPVVPMTGLLDLLAGAALRERPSAKIRGFEDVVASRWFAVPEEGVRFQVRVDQSEEESLDLSIHGVRASASNALTVFRVARGRVLLGPPIGDTASQLPHHDRQDARDASGLYRDGHLFHGPSLQALVAIVDDSANGRATGWIDAGRITSEPGTCHPGLLDVLTHVIPHDRLHTWSERVPVDRIAYPYRIPRLHLLAPLPTSGEVRVSVVFRGFDGTDAFPVFDIEATVEDHVVCRFRLVEVLVPAGPIGQAPAPQRRRFLCEREAVEGVGLATLEGDMATVRVHDIRMSDWLPGTLSAVYRTGGGEVSPRAARIAAQEWVADALTREGEPTHPGRVASNADGTIAHPVSHPVTAWRFELNELEDGSRVRFVRRDLDLDSVRTWWRATMGLGHWPVEDIYYGLIERFVADVVLEDPDDFAHATAAPVLYLANHQTGIESLLFSVLAGGLSQRSVLTVAKAEHRRSWLGTLIQHCFTWPGAVDPGVISFFDRENVESVPTMLAALRSALQDDGKSLLVHVEGTRALSEHQPVEQVGSAFLDLAIELGVSVVPCRFTHGLPVAPAESRHEFPVGYGRQRYWIGRAVPASTLARLPLRERKAVVLDGIQRLGRTDERPAGEVPAGDSTFAARVRDRVQRTGADEVHAVLLETLHEVGSPSDEVLRLLSGDRAGRLVVDDTPADRWLATLASALYGPRGAQIESPTPASTT
jgi:3-oxoacyl-(acyl-carrier-protein) synthase/3-hydroxymyristoyl/3-hydroxydecanoyl-(acyl carrier protein) dehydratase/1-acyl-sn-glycerol-3-phosphate acyltransferase